MAARDGLALLWSANPSRVPAPLWVIFASMGLPVIRRSRISPAQAPAPVTRMRPRSYQLPENRSGLLSSRGAPIVLVMRSRHQFRFGSLFMSGSLTLVAIADACLALIFGTAFRDATKPQPLPVQRDVELDLAARRCRAGRRWAGDGVRRDRLLTAHLETCCRRPLHQSISNSAA